MSSCVAVSFVILAACIYFWVARFLHCYYCHYASVFSILGRVCLRHSSDAV